MDDDTNFNWSKIAIIAITIVAVIIALILMGRITSIFE